MVSSARTSGGNWQAEIRAFDQDGPGVCGYYLDLVALLASLCPLTVEVEQTDGEWVQSKDPVLTTLLSGYRSPVFPQSDLVKYHVRARESQGEAWIVDSESVGYAVVTAPNATPTGEGALQWRDTFGILRITPPERLWRSIEPDPYEPWLPSSPLRRARGDLRRLRSAIRNQQRGSDSRLLTNGIVVFRDGTGGGLRPLAEPEEEGETLSGIDAVVDDFVEISKKAHQDDQSVGAAVPFPVIASDGDAIEYVELGRPIDPASFEMEQRALESFARTVNFPAQLLTNGPGAANHWNEWLLEESQRKMGLAPKLLPVCSDITEFHLRPLVRAAAGRIGNWEAIPAERCRVGFDTSFLTSKPDVTAQMIGAWTAGVADRDEVADALGIKSMLPIPEGMDPYVHWQIATGKPGAPYAEVQDGVLVTAPDVFADGGDPSALPLMDDPGNELPAPSEAPALPPAVETALGAANQAPPPTPPMLGGTAPVAALSPPEYVAAERAIDRLYAADAALDASLSTAAERCIEQITDHVAKELVKQHPSGSPRRAELRAMESVKVWAASDPAVRANFNLEATVREAAEDCSHTDAFEVTAAAALAALTLVGGGGATPRFNPDAGQTLFTAAVIAAILYRLNRGDGPAKVEPGHIRTAMAAAGGAAIAPVGSLQRGSDGLPVAADGTPWSGSTGMATGSEALAPILELVSGESTTYVPGQPAPVEIPVSWEWVHGFYGQPATPFPPHLALDGHRYRWPSDAGPWSPGDHTFCKCSQVLRVGKPATHGPGGIPL